MNPLQKVIAAATLGTMVEWAEFTFFAYMAEQLSSLFFPLDHVDWARFKTYAIFSASYFMRPLGALLFGHMGDRLGRKPALIASMWLMAIATMALGLLPTYKSIGNMAAIGLMLCRFLQSLAVSGEYYGASVFIFEHSGYKRPFLAGCWPAFAAAFGMMLGSFAATITSLPSMPSFAWRLPFILSGLTCFLIVYIRRSLTETPAFATLVYIRRSLTETPVFETMPQTQYQSRLPIWQAWQHHKSAMVCAAAFSMFMAVFAYIGNVYYKTLLVRHGIALHYAAVIITAGQGLAAGLTLVLGFYADRWGGKRLAISGFLIAGLLAPLIFYSAIQGSLMFAILGQLLYALIHPLVSAPMFGLILLQFPANTRYSGSAFASSISAAIFASTSLIFVDLWVASGYSPLAPGFYISLIGFIAAILVWFSAKKLN